MDSLIDRVRRVMYENQLVTRGDRLICGLSGGPDSVCLAHVLATLKDEYWLDIVLAHVNYHKRGEESDLDESLCRQLATELGLPVYLREASASDIETMSKHNFQNEARRFRYEFFESLCEKFNAQRIAVGHTADDVVESTLMHILRGSGLKGIAGIYPKSGTTVRPLIECTREEITEYLEANRVAYRIDSSNLGEAYSRNRIRNTLLPYLREQFSPQIDAAIFRTSRIARIAQEFIESHANRLWTDAVSRSRLGKIIISLERYTTSDEIIRFELLRRAQTELSGLVEHRGSMDLSLILDADRLMTRGRTGERSDLGAGVMIERGHDEVIVFKATELTLEQQLLFPGENTIEDFNLRIHGELLPTPLSSLRFNDEWEVHVDASALSMGDLTVRSSREGDAVRLLNAPGSKKVADIFIDRKIPRALRSEVPIVLSSGAIIWIVGVGIADSVKITEYTEKALKLHAEDYVIR
jgi:tRNA(Ile)-lysidine synthase